MNTVHNAYWVDKTLPKYEDYFILFGNREEGWNLSKEELKKFWRKAVKLSAYRSYGDVTLMYRGELIRAVNNFHMPLLDKSYRYKCTYKKYKYDKAITNSST